MLILPYQDHWHLAFAEIERVLSSCLEGLAIKVHHVGSTAVPGLAAKDIIDIDLEFSPLVQLADIKERLASLGYHHNGDQGIPQREVFKRNGRTEDHPVLDRIPHHLYACPTGSPELARHLKFRNHLRQSATDREQYAKLKRAIAREAGQDKRTYASLKEHQARAFVLGILEK